MPSFLSKLLGDGMNSKKLTAEMRDVLTKINKRTKDFEALVERAGEAGQHLQKIALLGDSIRSLEGQMEGMSKLVPELAAARDQADSIEKMHRRNEERVAQVEESTQGMRSLVGEIQDKLEAVQVLKNDIEGFLSVESQFRTFRTEANAMAEQLRHLNDGFGRIREQQDALATSQKDYAQRVQSSDAEFHRLRSQVSEATTRIDTLRSTLDDLSDVAAAIPGAKHQLATLTSLANTVAQKTAGLEQQREAVDRAIAQSENLSTTMRRIDQGLQQQSEFRNVLSDYRAKAEELTALHERVLQRSAEVTKQQEGVERVGQDLQEELGRVRAETAKAVERFDEENRGLDAVSQRVNDLRGALTNFEDRFSTLDDASQQIGDIRSKADALGAQLATVSDETAKLTEHAERLRTVRGTVGQLETTVQQVAERVHRIEQAQPTVEAVLHDLHDLEGSHERIQDALEQTRTAHTELVRMRKSQGETEAWMKRVEQTVDSLRAQARELTGLRPTVEAVRKDAEQAVAATRTIEERREAVEEMHRRLGATAALISQLDERTNAMRVRMDSTEQRFERFEEHSAEAERLANQISSVSTGVQRIEQRLEHAGNTVDSFDARANQVAALAERMRQLGTEVEQRQSALERASEHLERAATIREEAANTAQSLEQQLLAMRADLASAETRAERLEELTDTLDERSSGLRFFEKRLGQFDEQMRQWQSLESEIRRAIDDANARQSTVDTLHADMKRMFEMAERTTQDIRAVTEAHDEIAQTRALLEEVVRQTRTVQSTGAELESRRQQIAQAERRLARSEALLVDIQASLETLQSQKVIVDHALERAGTLSFQVRQAEAAIETLRSERGMVRGGNGNGRGNGFAMHAGDRNDEVQQAV